MLTDRIIDRLEMQGVLSPALAAELRVAYEQDLTDAENAAYSNGYEAGSDDAYYQAQEEIDYLYP